MDLAHPYAQASLGFKDPPEVHRSGDLAAELLRADSLWAAGKGPDALALLADLEKSEGWDPERFKLYAEGLRALAAGDLDAAYRAYSGAAARGPDVFAGERAVSIAFWMACEGRMLAAGCLLGDVVTSKPFAGGVLAFAQHINGDSCLAEKTARRAIEEGFDDPWTLHAVAHALYSQGRSEECARWLIEHRGRVADCSTFMRTHMEFHVAMCLIDLEDANALQQLLDGPLWAALSSSEQDDYWAATGVLNALWKAELRGLCVRNSAKHVASALDHLAEADVNKSKVFSLVVLRWSDPAGAWPGKVRSVDHEVSAAVAAAIEKAYTFGDWPAAAEAVVPVMGRFRELGASPEQREVLEEFAAVALAKAGREEVRTWLDRNRRPGVAWYERLQAT